MKYWLGILLFLQLHHSAISQERFTYRQCVSYTLSRNLSLQNSQLLVQKQNVVVENAKLGFLPRANAYSTYKIKSGRTLDDATNGYVVNRLFSNDWSVSGSVILFNGFRNIHRIAFERYNALLATEALKQDQNEIIYSLLEAYITHLLNIGLADVQSKQCEVSNQEFKRIEKMIEVGRAATVDRYDVQARLANDEYLLLHYQNAVKRSEMTLRKLMNYPLDSAFEIADIQFSNISSIYLADTIDPVHQLQSLPQLKQLEYNLRAAERILKLERGAFFPQFNLFSSWSSGYYESVVDANGIIMKFPKQMSKNRSINYGISLSFPLLDGLTWRNNVQIAKIELKQAQNRLSEEMNKINYEVRQAQQDFAAAIKEYNTAEKKAESERVAFEMVKKKRENGLVGIMEYFEVRNNSARAANEILRTRLQVYMMYTILMYYKTGSMITWEGQ